MADEPVVCICIPSPGDLPAPFLTQIPDLSAQVRGFSVGYELTKWRGEDFARHILEWVPDFALAIDEREGVPLGRLLSRSAEAVRKTFGSKFDPSIAGEIMLHAICRAQFGASTLVKKVWFRTSMNVPYNGFDSVHVVHSDSGLELWLGEAKFYKSGKKAVGKVVADMEQHLAADYLHDEFALVGPKIPEGHPHAAQMKLLMDANTTLDDVFDVLTLPVLIMYDSPIAAGHTAVTDEYLAELAAEIEEHAKRLLDGVGSTLRPMVRMFAIPTATKEHIVSSMKSQVQKWL